MLAWLSGITNWQWLISFVIITVHGFKPEKKQNYAGTKMSQNTDTLWDGPSYVHRFTGFWNSSMYYFISLSRTRTIAVCVVFPFQPGCYAVARDISVSGKVEEPIHVHETRSKDWQHYLFHNVASAPQIMGALEFLGHYGSSIPSAIRSCDLSLSLGC